MWNARQIAVSTLIIMLVAGAACAQDWPQWRGPNRDGKAASFDAPATWPQTLTKQWTANVGQGDASPLLVGDHVYVYSRQGADEVATCLNAADGSVVWSTKVPTPAVQGPSSRHPGPRATPAVADGKMVTLGVTGVLSCFDTATGKLAWQKNPFPGVHPRFYTASSPLIVNGLAIAHLGGPGNGAMIAYSLDTGDEMGRWGGEGPAYSSPVLMTVGGVQQAVEMADSSIVGVSLTDGSLLWQIPFKPQGRAYNSSTPVVNGDVVYYSGSARGTFAVRIATGGNGFTVTKLWSNPDIACQFSSPVLHDGFLYGMSDKGKIFCLNAQTGAAAWVNDEVIDRGTFAEVVDFGTAIGCLPSSGELTVFAPDSTAFKQLARIKVSDTPTYACPALSGKRIIVKGEQAVTSWLVP